MCCALRTLAGQEPVGEAFQPPAEGLLGEGVDDKRDGGRSEMALRGVAQGQQSRERAHGELVEFEREGDEQGEHDRLLDQDAHVEQPWKQAAYATRTRKKMVESVPMWMKRKSWYQ